MCSVQLPKIKLIANDGKTFEVDQDVAFKSEMIKKMYAGNELMNDNEVSVIEADGETLEKIIEYCIAHKSEEYVNPEKENQRIHFTDKDVKYLKGLSDEFLLQLLTGASYLQIPGLLDIISQTIANMISGEIRKIYNTPDDLPMEQLKEVENGYQWLN